MGIRGNHEILPGGYKHMKVGDIAISNFFEHGASPAEASPRAIIARAGLPWTAASQSSQALRLSPASCLNALKNLYCDSPAQPTFQCNKKGTVCINNSVPIIPYLH